MLQEPELEEDPEDNSEFLDSQTQQQQN